MKSKKLTIAPDQNTMTYSKMELRNLQIPRIRQNMT